MNSSDSKQKQDLEVSGWWNDEKTKKWQEYYYSDKNPMVDHVLERQKKSLKFLESLKLKPGSKILELGYGGGQTAKKILELGFNYTGVDISNHLKESAERKCVNFVKNNKAKFIVGNIDNDLEFHHGQFDVVLVMGALQYITDPNKCFKEVNRVLKVNGHFIVCQANMYAFILEIFNLRRFMTRVIYLLFREKYVISTSFKGILTQSKMSKFFKKYENSKFMNTKFMLKGDPEWKYDIKKPLFSFLRLKTMFINNEFKILSKTGATYFIPKNKFNSFTIKGVIFRFFKIFNNILQFIGDKNLIPYFFTVADNIIMLGEKKKNVQK